MRRALPTLSREYGLLPWHFGGPDELTYAEQSAYLDDYHERGRRAEQDARRRARGRR